MLRGLLAFLHQLPYSLFLFHFVCHWDIMAIVLIRFTFFLVPPRSSGGRFTLFQGGVGYETVVRSLVLYSVPILRWLNVLWRAGWCNISSQVPWQCGSGELARYSISSL